MSEALLKTIEISKEFSRIPVLHNIDGILTGDHMNEEEIMYYATGLKEKTDREERLSGRASRAPVLPG